MSSAGDPNLVTAGVVAGIVICSLLFLVVVALLVYNIYLWHRRRTADRDARQRQLNRKYDTGWRPSDVLYAPQDDHFKRGSGNVNQGFAPSTAGSTVAGSTVSMNSGRSRGVGPAPRAQYEDISDDEEVGTGNATGNHLKPPRPTLQYHSPPPAYDTFQEPKRPPGVRSNGTGSTHTHAPPYSQSVPSPHARPEVTLRPHHLQAEWDRGVPPPVNGAAVGAQHFRSPTSTAQKSTSGRRLPAVEQRSSCLAVLSADTSRLRTSDVSLTGFGAQYVPSIGLKTSVHNGGLGYNDY